MDWIPLAEQKQARYESSHGEEDERAIVRRGNAAYAAGLALLMAGDAAAPAWLMRAAERWPEARHVAESLRERDDFPHDVADALAFVAAHDPVAYAEAVDSVVDSFETRAEFLEDVPVADTALVLDRLAARRGIAHELPESPVLPG